MIAIPPSPRTATPRSSLPLATIVLWFVAWPTRAPAQLYAGLDAAFASRYVWRGVTRVDGAALQPEGYLGLQLDDGYLSAGAWGSYELSRAGPSGLSDLGPGRTGFGEIDYWSQYARALGPVQTSLGFIRYTYRGTLPGPSRTSAASTSEVYGTIQLSRKYLAPRLAAYWDVDRVRGLYLESSGTLPIMANPLGEPFWALYVRGLAGYSLGQELNPAQPNQVANFAGRGLTHVDLSLSFDLRPGPLTLHHESHAQWSVDDATRRTSADPADDRRVKFWFELSASWTPRVLKW